MIKPYEILEKTRTLGRPIRLNIYTQSGLGNGGFLFDYNSNYVEIDGMEVSVKISGSHINPFGPLKKDFTCHIEFRVEAPYDWKNTENQKESYSYYFSYKETFRGPFSSRNAEDICEKFLTRAADYFEKQLTYYRTGDDDNYSEYRHMFYIYKPGTGIIKSRCIF